MRSKSTDAFEKITPDQYNYQYKDLKKLINSAVQYAIIGDGVPGCFQRTKAVFEFLADRLDYGFEAQYYLNGLIVIGRKNLKCTLPTDQHTLFAHSIKSMPKEKTKQAILDGGYDLAVATGQKKRWARIRGEK